MEMSWNSAIAAIARIAENWESLLAILVVIAGAWLIVSIRRTEKSASATPSTSLPASAKLFLYASIGGIVSFMIWDLLQGREVAGFGSVAGLTLIGLALFISIMGALSFVYGKLSILNAAEPFGLPPGSVRAILTIAFIVLTGVMSSFLITGHNGRTTYSPNGVVVGGNMDEASANALAGQLREQFKSEAIVAARREISGEKFEVSVFAKADNSLVDDISKQTLTMVSTILAALIGFYFAARMDGDSGGSATIRKSGLRGELTAALASAPDEANLSTATTALIQKISMENDTTKKKAMEEILKILTEAAGRKDKAAAALNDPAADVDSLETALRNIRADRKSVV